ncbi:hypothetical protein ABBQ32_011160 [Trebouxia sp. C0010 RCD-2024]
MSGLDNEYVTSVDGQEISTPHAQKLCMRMFYAGIFLLPWLWVMNVWLFWHDFRHGRDLVIQKYTRHSAAGFGLVTAMLLAWVAAFSLGQEEWVGEAFFDKYNLASIDPAELQA